MSLTFRTSTPSTISSGAVVRRLPTTVGKEIWAVPPFTDHRELLGKAGIGDELVGSRFRLTSGVVGKTDVVVAALNQHIPAVALDQDVFFHRRREMAENLARIVNAVDGDACRDIRVHLAAAVVKQCILSSLDPTHAFHDDDLWFACARNTQARLDSAIEELMAGKRKYDPTRYSSGALLSGGYSHIEHFAWLYWSELSAIVAELRKSTRRLTIVDLATGSGSFLVAARAFFRRAGLSSPVRLVGIDRSEERLQTAHRLYAATSGIDVECLVDDLTSPGFGDRLRRLAPDLVVANHSLEHLPGELENTYVHDWLLAARCGVFISVPLHDKLETTISDHVREFTPEIVERLGKAMELRVAYAATADGLTSSKHGGACFWRIELPKLTFHGSHISINAKAGVRHEDSLLADFERKFDPEAFGRSRRAARIAAIQDTSRFSSQGAEPRQVRQLPIKLPGTSICLPVEFSQFAEAIQLMADHNKTHNPWFDSAFAYLNVFRGWTMFSSYRGLSLNCHGDQLQSLSGQRAYLPDYSYIVSDNLPTILFDQEFDVSDAIQLARSGLRVNIYDWFNTQADPRRAYFTENYSIYLLSPYVIHSAQAADQDLFRVFLKVAFSTKRFFDNRELRRNSAFEYGDWFDQNTVGYADGWLHHAHWNERFVWTDICGDRSI